MAANDNEDKQQKQPEKAGLRSLLFGLWTVMGKNKDESNELSAEDALDAAQLADEEENAEDAADSAPPPKNENLVRAKGNRLYEFYLRHKGMPPVETDEAELDLSLFNQNSEPMEREQRGWLGMPERSAGELLKISAKEEEPPTPARAFGFIGGDRLGAWLFMLPPLFGGPDADPAMVMAALKEKGIVAGIDEQLVADMCEEKRYFELVKIAQGTPAVDGVDGSIEDHFRREHEIQLTVKDDNTIDYKDLGWLQTVVEGDVICTITPPTEAVSGMDVRGNEVKGRNGRNAIVPGGQGTRVDEENLTLVAAADGVLTFTAQRFRVDPLLIIKGNVDTATGNLNVVGDVLVNGDIQEGFTVEATGNITVQGMVEGAQVFAGGNIQVGRGMNGNSHGVMQAKGDIRCKFIENATAIACGQIICDTIINSTISSDSIVTVKTGRGAIIGGNITALERIDALSIGNQSNRSMVVTMGSTANFLKEKYELEMRRKEVADDVAEINKNISFLSRSNQTRTEEMERMLSDFKLKLTVQRMQLANLDRRLVVMNRKQTDISECRIRAEVLYPPLQITMGSFTKIMRETAFNALVYCKEGEIHIANV